MTDCLKAMIEMFAASRGAQIEIPRYTQEKAETQQPKEETAEEVINRISANLMSMGK